MLYTPASDFYSLLQIPRDASPGDIKIAFRRTLLRLHPDKQRPHSRSVTGLDTAIATSALATTGASAWPRRSPLEESEPVDIALLTEAYRTLSDAGLRAAYDGSLREERATRSVAVDPRPAQVVSLEEFEFARMETGPAAVAVAAQPLESSGWRYKCRCGGMYRITEDDLEKETHLVGCESCSEVIWVGYEEAGTEDEEQG